MNSLLIRIRSEIRGIKQRIIVAGEERKCAKWNRRQKIDNLLNITRKIHKLASKGIAQDPLVTDGGKYSVILENERVRVLSYHDKPGDRTFQHVYPDYVMYAESSFKRRLTFPDGRKQEVGVKAGSTGWMKGHIHIGENIGDTNTDVILIGLKEDRTLGKREKNLK